MKRLIITVFGILCLCGCVKNQANVGEGDKTLTAKTLTSTATTTTAVAYTKPKIIPWIECNDNSMLNSTVESLLQWKPITDTVIVSTTRNHNSLYSSLRLRLGMRVIPGLKLSSYMKTFDDVAGWRALGTDCFALFIMYGERTIILESETAFSTCIDLVTFRKGLSFLPPGLEYIWYPSIKSINVDRQKQLAIDKIIGDVLHPRFADQSFGHPLWRTFPDWVEVSKILDSYTFRKNIPIVWTYCSDNFCYWSPDQIKEILELTRNYSEIIIYPSSKYAKETGITLTKILK